MAKTDNLKDYLTALATGFRNATNSTEKINAQTMLDLPIQLSDSYKELQKIVSKNYTKDQDINVPLGITKVGSYAYAMQSGYLYINKLNISEGVQRVENYAFYNTYAKEIYLPSTITYVGSSNFREYSQTYQNLVFFNSDINTFLNKQLTNIWDSSNTKDKFLNCNNNGNLYCKGELITNVVVPKELKTLSNLTGWGIKGSFSFEENSQIETINHIPFCEKLYLPKGPYKFNFGFGVGNSPLPNEIYYDGTMQDYLNIIHNNSGSFIGSNGAKIYFNNELLTEITIPNGIITIPDNAFLYFDNNFDYVVIPESVVQIGQNAFTCKTANKGVVRILSHTPPTIPSSPFYNVSKIIVPASELSIFKSATNWSKYGSILVPDTNIEVSIDSSLLNNENILYSVDGGTKQQFTNSSLSLEGVGTLTIYNTSSETIKLGKTNGGTEVGTSGPSTTITYTFTDVSNLYITKA